MVVCICFIIYAVIVRTLQATMGLAAPSFKPYGEIIGSSAMYRHMHFMFEVPVL
jgi:hypothetical protein